MKFEFSLIWGVGRGRVGGNKKKKTLVWSVHFVGTACYTDKKNKEWGLKTI